MIDPAVALTSELVKIPSHPGVPQQERAVALKLREFLEGRGVVSRLIEVRDGRPNLLATVDSGRPGPHLLWNGHTDTVPLNRDGGGVGFTGAQVGDAIEGRGTADMKGALAAMAVALASLREGAGLTAGRVTFAAVIDEEMESLGCEALIASGFSADGAVIGEPTENRVALGHKGLEWLEIVVTGKAAHGGRPEAGVNAIDAAAHFIGLVESHLVPALARRVHPLLGPPTINFGTIAGGDQPSTVAARCTLRLDRRSIPGESFASMCAELSELLSEVEHQRTGITTTLSRMPGGMATLEHLSSVLLPDHPLARAAGEAARAVTGISPSPLAFPAWTDAGLLANFASIPCVILGPGDLSVAHSPHESVPVRQITDAVAIYREIGLRFCAGAV
jgi:acetylornithine deacetylase/succinyl-diaminopimelate desuccinylase family protein